MARRTSGQRRGANTGHLRGAEGEGVGVDEVEGQPEDQGNILKISLKVILGLGPSIIF